MTLSSQRDSMLIKQLLCQAGPLYGQAAGSGQTKPDATKPKRMADSRIGRDFWRYQE